MLLNSSTNPFNKAQLARIAEKMDDVFRGNAIFKKLGSQQQTLATEAIMFSFKYAPFKYNLHTDTKIDEITKVKTVTKTYEFQMEFTIPGIEHSIEFKRTIPFVELDRIL